MLPATENEENNYKFTDKSYSNKAILQMFKIYVKGFWFSLLFKINDVKFIYLGC